MRLKLLTLAAVLLAAHDAVLHAAQPPSRVFILVDDLGYADIGPFGSMKIARNELKKRAEAKRPGTKSKDAP